MKVESNIEVSFVKENNKKLQDLIDTVSNKRVKILLEIIRDKGFCTTEDLQNSGYEHAPRAARDAKDLGIPIITEKTIGSSGKKIGKYVLGDINDISIDKLKKTSGRTNLSKKLKKELIKRYGSKCFLYYEKYPERTLQIDHRIPYEIGGDPADMTNIDYFMLLSPSANREKSWACEHCSNFKTKDIEFCKTCFYAYPDKKYTHVADAQENKIELIFKENDKDLYDEIVEKSKEMKSSPSDYIIHSLKTTKEKV